MHKESSNEETSHKKSILRRRPSTETTEESATLYNTNNQSMTSGGPVCVHAPERIGQLPKAEEIASTPGQNLYADHCGKNRGDFKMRFKSPFFRRGCSKYCTGINRELESSSFKLTVCSNKKNKLAYRIKRSKRRLLQFSNQVKKRTKKSVKKIKGIYKNIGARRAMGFTCDLKKCPSTIEQCSESSCAKPNMLFSKFNKFKEKLMREEPCGDECCTRTQASSTNHEFKILRDQSVGTDEDKGTST